jgi:signal transduction histidine kinase
MSIRRLLILAFVSISLLPSAVLTLLAFSQAREALSSEIARNLESQAVSLMERIDWMLFERFENMRTWAQLDVMQETRINDLDKRISALLTDLKIGHGVYSQIFCTTTDGQVVAASDPGLIGNRVLPQPVWLDFPLSTGTIALEDFSFRPPFTETALRMPLPDLFGQEDEHGNLDASDPLGTLYAEFDWAEILNILDQVSQLSQARMESGQSAAQNQGRMAVLLDAEGRLIAASSLLRQNQLQGHLKSGFENNFTLSQNGDASQLTWQFEPAPDKIHDARSGVFLTDGQAFGQAAVLVGYGESQGVQSFAGFGWSLFVLQPTSHAYRPVWQMGSVFLILLVVTGAGAVGVSLFIAARIAEPVVALTDYTRRFTRDGTSGQAPSSGPGAIGEIGELTQAYTHMMRDLEKSREQLVRAAKLAVAGEMAAAMTHEIRTPLGILRSSAQMLQRETQLSAEGHEMASFVMSETDRLNQLVSSLLSFARPRAPEFQPHDIHQIMQHTLSMLAPQAERKEIQIRTDFRASPAVIACDEEQLVQVFLNLLINAFQALPAGGQIEVRTRGGNQDLQDNRDSQHVLVEVADNGPGVSLAHRERIFEPFFTTRENGIGLGLSVVQQIVHAHTGDMNVEENAGGGACFRLSFVSSSSHAPLPHISHEQQKDTEL